MLFRLKLFATSFASGALLLIVLCLGSQNLNNRQSLQLGIATSAPLPPGFLIGISLVLGVVTGGSTAALLLPKESEE